METMKTVIKNYKVFLQEAKENTGYKVYIINSNEEKFDKCISERVCNNYIRNKENKYNSLLRIDKYPFTLDVDNLEDAEKIVKDMIEVYDSRDKKEELKNNVIDSFKTTEDLINDCCYNFYIDITDQQKEDLEIIIQSSVLDYVNSL